MTDTTVHRAEALFASWLQVSQTPTADQVRTAVAEMLARVGAIGCAECVAQEYGEHPAEAARRMIWVLAAMRAAFPTPETPTA